MSQFIKYGDTYLRQSDDGSLFPVVDSETIKGLKFGQLPYTSGGINKPLRFAESSSSAPTSSTPSAPDDLGSLIKNKLSSALMNYKGVTNTAELETKRQELLRKQLLSSPYSTEGENTLTGAQKLSLLRNRGSEFEPEIKSLEEQIIQAKNGDAESLNTLSKLMSLAKDAGVLGAEGGYQSALGKEYADYVANEKALGKTKVMSLNEYANMDANRKRAITTGGDSGLSASTLAKVTAIAQSHDSNQLVKDYNTIQNKSGSMQKILESGVGGPGDLALVYEFMKALDPNSVVRETEYATAAKSGNIFAGVFARFNGYLKEEGGFLPKQVQNAFVSIMKTKLDVAQKQYDNYHSEQARKINKITGKVDGEDYLTNYGNVTFDSQSKSSFSDIEQYIVPDPTTKTATIPRSIWKTLGNRMDALIADVKSSGYKLLVTD